MGREVHVQQQVVLHLLQQLQTLTVTTLVEALDDLAQLRLQLQEEFELRAADDLLEQLGPVEGGEGGEAAVDGHVVGGHEVGAVAVVQRGREELLGGRGVFSRHEVSEAAGAAEPGDRALVVVHLGGGFAEVGGGQRLVDVADDMGPVLEVDGDLDHVDTHGHHVAAGGAVVPGPGVTLQGIGQVTSAEKYLIKNRHLG